MNESTDIDDTLFRLWRVRRTLMQLCHDRGYQVPAEQLELSQEDFVSEFGESPSCSQLSKVFVSCNDPEVKLSVFFPNEKKVGVASIRGFLEEIVMQNIYNAIVIVQSSMTPSANKAIRECNAAGRHIQVFEAVELVVNITRHRLVPKHELQTPEEKAALLERYKLKPVQLPRIKVSDPVSRYYGFRRGQVVKITRAASPSAGRYVTYRLVY